MKRVPAQARSKQKYEKIAEVALRLFIENGFYNTTTNDIAKESNIAVGTLYSYFDDKYDILDAALEFNQQRASVFFNKTIQTLDFDVSLEDLLVVIIQLFIDYKKSFFNTDKFSEEFHAVIINHTNGSCALQEQQIADNLLKSWSEIKVVDEKIFKKLPSILLIIDTVAKDIAFSRKPSITYSQEEIRNIAKTIAFYINL